MSRLPDRIPTIVGQVSTLAVTADSAIEPVSAW